MMYMPKRQKYPRAGVTHQVTARDIEAKKKRLLRIGITLKNTGDILLEIRILMETLFPSESAFADDFNNAITDSKKRRLWHCCYC
jgi:hypothetical protein